MKALAAVLLMASVCAGQKPHAKVGDPCDHTHTVIADGGLVCPRGGVGPWKWVKESDVDEHGYLKSPKPLKCGKYEHLDHWPGQCGPTPTTCPDGQVVGCYAVSICAAPPPDKCAPDLHVVTEAEWQDMLATQTRLQKALEHMLSAMQHQANFDDRLIKERKSGAGKE